MGTKRRRGAKIYYSYGSNEGIWPFGGVLWYTLCGEPPFKNIEDSTGEAMFNNIMHGPLDTNCCWVSGRVNGFKPLNMIGWYATTMEDSRSTASSVTVSASLMVRRAMFYLRVLYNCERQIGVEHYLGR